MRRLSSLLHQVKLVFAGDAVTEAKAYLAVFRPVFDYNEHNSAGCLHLLEFGLAGTFIQLGGYRREPGEPERVRTTLRERAELRETVKTIGMTDLEGQMRYAESLGLEWTMDDMAALRKEVTSSEDGLEDLSEEEL